MSYNFPNAPTEGTVFAPSGGPTYTFTGGVWRVKGAASGSSVTVADAPPASPASGDMWYESDSGRLFVFFVDAGGGAGQWVQVGAPAGTKPGQWELIDTKTATGSAPVDFDYETAGWPTGYDEFELQLNNVLPATDNTYLYQRVKSGSTWVNTGSSYNWGVLVVGNSGTPGGDGQGAGTAGATLIGVTRTGAGQGLTTTAGSTGYVGTIRFRNPTDEAAANRRVGFRSEGSHTQPGGTNVPSRTLGIGEFASAALVQGVRFGVGSGQPASGTFKLFGRRR